MFPFLLFLRSEQFQPLLPALDPACVQDGRTLLTGLHLVSRNCLTLLRLLSLHYVLCSLNFFFFREGAENVAGYALVRTIEIVFNLLDAAY